ncbi:MAG: L-seryl-tRNA(Sec) selenium transferase [bacterium]|nr:L-seryl-tRNA(Sec) selenium transferase [bacterium]
MASKVIKTLRDFPAVEELMQSDELSAHLAALPRPIAAAVVKQVVASLKKKLSDDGKPISGTTMINALKRDLVARKSRELARVINGTGIVVHTNLGRAPLSESIFEDIKRTVVGYGNIEFDMRSGARGHRGEACEDYLRELSGAEAGTVVNNCAAALLIILNTLANRKKVLISRGELVQIGGGFRIPDILKRSGAKLCEVGTTNITSLSDYEENIDSQTGLIMKVHKSNFVQAGFTEEVPLKKLAELGKKHDVPVLNDLGSGVFISTEKILGYREETVQDSVRAGASITCFSGDKMLGGVQAGLIVGDAALVKKVKKNPIFRTVRVDKIVFSILERLLKIYLEGTHAEGIKLWQVLATKVTELRGRGEKVLKETGSPEGVNVEKTAAFVGGGAFPEKPIESIGLVFDASWKARQMMKSFRDLRPPIIGRIEDDRFIVDLRTIDPSDLPHLVDAIRNLQK